MSRAEAAGAVTVVSTVAALGLFLPGIDKTWNAHPNDPDEVARLRMGEGIYLSVALVLTLLASYANGSTAPFVVGFGLALVIVCAQEYALSRPGKGG